MLHRSYTNLAKHLRLQLRLVIYLFNTAKSMYLFAFIITAIIVMMLISILPAVSPFILKPLARVSYQNGDANTDWTYKYNASGIHVFGDFIYIINKKSNSLDICTVQRNRLSIEKRIKFSQTRIKSRINAVNRPDIPIFYTYTDIDSIRYEYAFNPVTMKFFLLYQYNKDTFSYNIGNDGVKQEEYQFVIYNNCLYYLVLRMGIEKTSPPRGLWKLDFATGQTKQILSTACFPFMLNQINYHMKPLLIVTYEATCNGATYRESSDEMGCVMAYDLRTEELLWTRNYPLQHAIFLHTFGKPDNLAYLNKVIITYTAFQEYSAEKLKAELLNPLTGEVEQTFEGIVTGDTAKLLEYLSEDNIIYYLRPQFLLTDDFFKVSKQKQWKPLLELFHRPFPVFRHKNQLLFFIQDRTKRQKRERFVDTHGKEYLSLKQQDLFGEFLFFEEIATQIYFYKHGDQIILSLFNCTPQKTVENAYLFKPRSCFGFYSSMYQFSTFLKYKLAISLTLLALCLIIAVSISILVIDKHYQLLKQFSAFLTSPDLIFKSNQEISGLLKTKVVDTSILVIRVVNLNQILSEYPDVSIQSEITGKILQSLADTCYRSNVIIDKYLNEGMMLILTDQNISTSARLAYELSKQITLKFEALTKALKLPHELIAAFGLSYGKNLLGLFGSKTKKDYTCVGKYVNLAFRLAYSQNTTALATHEEAIQGANLPGRVVKLALKGFETTDYYIVDLS